MLDKTSPYADNISIFSKCRSTYRHLFCILCIAVGTSKLEQLLGKSHRGCQILLSEQLFLLPNQALLLLLIQPDRGATEQPGL